MFGCKKIQGSAVEFRIKGMHCAACSMNIDGALEELDGVIGATTSYAKEQHKLCMMLLKFNLPE